jgi:tRNA (adenine57-N1/adenine58-N1)-methyltransferase
MIPDGQRVLLIHEGKEYYVRAGEGTFSTDKGIIDLNVIREAMPGDVIETHLGIPFYVRIPRPTDFFAHARRTGAPMLPKDIGAVCALTGMNKNDDVLDAGTGSGIAAIFFGGIAKTVTTYEIRDEFAKVCRKNIEEAGLDNVQVIAGDMLDAAGAYDIVHLDLQITEAHIRHAHALLKPGGYLATYTPFLEQTFIVMDTAEQLFTDLVCHELIGRELTRTKRGTRPSTRVSHSGYITVARKE